MTNHPCKNKCPNFVDEQCCHCLVQDKTEVELKNADEAKFYAQAIKAEQYIT